jgi:cytochrome c biogenesis protein CcdA
MAEILKWITSSLLQATAGPLAMPLAFLLGLVSAAASACCTLPAIGMLAAYAGTRQDTNRHTAFMSAIWFLTGTTLFLIILGFVVGLAGQAAQIFLGKYWKLFAGAIAIIIGLATLKLLPFKLPKHSMDNVSQSYGVKMGAMLGGLFIGGGVAASSLPCNPGIFIVLGTSILMGQILWGMLLMAAFAVGFSLPLAAILFGVSFGKVSIKAQKVDTAIRVIAGVLLICAGFYLLVTC